MHFKDDRAGNFNIGTGRYEKLMLKGDSTDIKFRTTFFSHAVPHNCTGSAMSITT